MGFDTSMFEHMYSEGVELRQSPPTDVTDEFPFGSPLHRGHARPLGARGSGWGFRLPRVPHQVGPQGGPVLELLLTQLGQKVLQLYSACNTQNYLKKPKSNQMF